MKARPTIYNGIQMRSRLEARVAAWFDSIPMEWKYEPVAFAGAEGQYLPDFVWPASVGCPNIYWEVKPTMDHALDARDKMPVIWGSEPDAILAVLSPDTATARGTVLLRYKATAWHERYLVKCPCGTLLWAHRQVFQHSEKDVEDLYQAYCSRCDDLTLRTSRAVLKLPEWNA